jgi:hypothetical protein
MVPQVRKLPAILRRPRSAERPSPGLGRLHQHHPTLRARRESHRRPRTTVVTRWVRKSTRHPSPPISLIGIAYTLPSTSRRNRPRLSRCPARLLRRRLGIWRRTSTRAGAKELPLCCQEWGMGIGEEGLRYATYGNGTLHATASRPGYRRDRSSGEELE